MLPVETHFFQAARYLITYPYRRTEPADITIAELLRRLEEAATYANSQRDAQSDGVVDGLLDLDAFSRVLRSGVSGSRVDPQESFVTLARAYHEGAHGTGLPAESRIVEKSVENAEVAAYWLKSFPDASFIHIIRNPYANLVSLRQYKTTRGRFPHLKAPLQALRNSYEYLYRNQKTIAGYVVVRYEDLVSDVETEMRRICRQLDLEYNHYMSRPTFLGEPWGGNSVSGRTFEGVSGSRKDSWKTAITPLETEAVNKVFAGVLRDHDYSVEPSRGSPWRPIRGESPKVYLRNRALLAELP